MRIVVLVKHVPDALADRGFTADRRCDRQVVSLLSELDEYALEVARRADGDVEVIALTVGPPEAVAALRRALSMGADRAVHVCDDAIAGSDALGTARVLAAAITLVGDVDLVLTGASSTDAGTSLVPVQVATLLALPVLVAAESVELADGRVRVRRGDELEDVVLSAPMPAVISVTDRSPEPMYPTARAVMMARRRLVEQWQLTDLGLTPAQVGAAAATTRVLEVQVVPPRPAGRLLHDDGTAGRLLAEFLAEVTA